MQTLCLLIVLAPLAGAIAAGLFGRRLGRVRAHRAAIAGVATATFLSFLVFWQFVIGKAAPLDYTLYTWLQTGSLKLQIGFLIDPLSATMMLVVSFVSCMIHIYTIGYMAEDPGYQRFFGYISLFTFSMLMLVMANNFLQLFFGWEAVGLVSYLLIGFWYQRESAIAANLKAFLVNRVGDFGFLLGIAAVLYYTKSLDYAPVFQAAPALAHRAMTLVGEHQVAVPTLICILLFIGAMGKSAQVPLHVWLPDSMEGPTPISALIHAATMVTAGIFMVSRMSPLFELSPTALSFVLLIGAVTAFSMGLLGLVQNDIKRVIAYSTLSQLGYMTVALGASAYQAAIFHLVTHAFFKALLFLAAGSVIIGLHHEQDMRRMGGLYRHMPITWLCSVIGTLALVGFPGFAGFFSKDAIIEAVHLSHRFGAGVAVLALKAGVFVTALYSFRLLFLVFHGQERLAHGGDTHDDTAGHAAHVAIGHDGHEGHAAHATPQESPWVVTGPLLALAVPSIFLGGILAGDMLFGDYFGQSIYVAPENQVLKEMAEEYHGALSFTLHGFFSLPFFLLVGGAYVAYLYYLVSPGKAAQITAAWPRLYALLLNKYGFDDFNNRVFAAGARLGGGLLSHFGDGVVIDGWLVNGSAKVVGWLAAQVRWIQTGYLYHYAFAMILGLLCLLTIALGVA